MGRIQRSEEELKEALKEQLQFVRRSSQAYDDGNPSEAKILANCIRILVKDKGASRSLLLSLKSKHILFLSTAKKYRKGYVGDFFALGSLKLSSKGAEYSPYLGDISPEVTLRWIPFNEWWDEVVVIDSAGVKFSRQTLLLSVCEMDGGSHVDPAIEPEYAALASGATSGLVFTDPSGVERKMKGIHLATVRQIAYELETTITTKLAALLCT